MIGSAGALCASGFVSMSPGDRPDRGSGSAIASTPIAFRRLNELQYRRSIEQAFGPGLEIPGRFEPSVRDGGLLAIGASSVTVTSSGLEQYQLRARNIASQVMAKDRRGAVMTCAPRSDASFDRLCASRILSERGRLLYRRPLARSELKSVLDVAAAATKQSGSFATGLQLGLTRLLASPNFLFRVERGVEDAANPDALTLDDYSLASRISFLLWDAPPDAELLDVASRGDLRDPAQLERQVDRMIASPRFADGVRSFFSDMFGYDQFGSISKDQAIYPRFTSELLKDAREQALLTIVDHLVASKGDYRDLFTTRHTFINRNLGAIYNIQVSNAGMTGFSPYTFGTDELRRGILTLPAFLMLDPNHPGRSSPTIRGKVVRELLLCQRVPDPPPNVNSALVSDTHSELYKTARQRLSIHRESPACAGCHKLTDPIGLALENYDAIGQYRTLENGVAIDPSGEFEGKPYKDALQLTALLHDSPTPPACAVQRTFEYGVGRAAGGPDKDWLRQASQTFAERGYRFADLMRLVATSAAFRTIPVTIPPARSMAALTAPFHAATQRQP